MNANHKNSLVEIECSLGVYANIGIAKATRRDAGRLQDAMLKGSREEVAAIFQKHWKQMVKGQVQGGPKQVKTGCPVRIRIAEIAQAWLVQSSASREVLL